MKKLIDFEYDLWTTEDGRCMVRVRLTKEECQVDRETFRLLRAEEKRLRRERTPEKEKTVGKKEAILSSQVNQPLSLQTICSTSDENGEFWLADTRDFANEVVISQFLEQFRQQLTLKQLDVFEKCLLGGMSLRTHSRETGCAFSTVKGIQDEIRKKFKKIF